MEIRVGPPTVTIHADDQFCVCAANAEMSSTLEQGYFAADTRLVSGYRIKLGRMRPVLLNSAATGHHCARFEFTNPAIQQVNASPLAESSLHLRLDRTIGTGIHEDYEVTNYSRDRVEVDLEISIESDFADLFDVKAHQPVLRGSLRSTWNSDRLIVDYENESFKRRLVIEMAECSSPPSYVNGGMLFRVALEPRQEWHTCMLWRYGGDPPPRCSDLAGDSQRHDLKRSWVSRATRYVTSSPVVNLTVAQAVDDLAGLRMHRHDPAASGGSGGSSPQASTAGGPGESSPRASTDQGAESGEIAEVGALFSGDLLFAGSIGRTDLPGGDYQTMLDSLARVCLPLPDDTVVLAGHGPLTTIGAERAHNPFLKDLVPTTGPARGL
jgi:hypothetical protein